MSIDQIIANAAARLSNSFDGRKAMEIRIEAGLSRDVLARRFGYKGRTPGDMIKKFENGEAVPVGKPGTAAKKYLAWIERNRYRLNK